MSTTQGVKTVSVRAGSAVSIYRWVALDPADGQYDHVGTAQARMDGVSMMAQPTVDGAFPMAVDNGAIVKVECGGTVAAGADVGSDNVGRAITAVSGVGNYVGGRALEAGVLGQIIEVRINIDLDQVA